MQHTVTSTDGVQLHVEESGNRAGRAILFLHGFAQCGLCWARQVDSEALASFRLVTMDLRGHGRSTKPSAQEAYTRSTSWADDIDAVMRALGLHKPVLVAWSYSGLVLCDYLTHRGDSALAGVHWVSARTMVGTPRAATMSGSLFRELVPGFCSADAEARVDAVIAFLRSLTAQPIGMPDFYTMLGYNLDTPPHVCRALLSRICDNDEVLRGVTVPALITHGDADTSVLLAMAEHHHALMPTSTMSTYAGVGHAPFYEAPERFNRELRDFMGLCVED